MKRIALILVSLIIGVTSLLAQDFNRTDAKGRRQGAWRGFYPNGQIRYEGQFMNDKCKGTFKYYDEQGNLKATNEFDKSGEQALNKTYAPNGRMIATGYYLNQKKEGEWKYYDEASGQLKTIREVRCTDGRDSITRITVCWPKRHNMLRVSQKGSAKSIRIQVF